MNLFFMHSRAPDVCHDIDCMSAGGAGRGAVVGGGGGRPCSRACPQRCLGAPWTAYRGRGSTRVHPGGAMPSTGLLRALTGMDRVDARPARATGAPQGHLGALLARSRRRHGPRPHPPAPGAAGPRWRPLGRDDDTSITAICPIPIAIMEVDYA